jgi:hypothetical protein
VAAIVFMLTSLTLAYMSGGKVVKSVVSDVQVPIEQSAQTDNDARRMPIRIRVTQIGRMPRWWNLVDTLS